MVGQWSGNGRALAGQWPGNGRAMAGQWPGDGRAMVSVKNRLCVRSPSDYRRSPAHAYDQGRRLVK
eukprot:11195400-Lingulodinium_polyedra.AAC.1